jgi:hypothetical protein
MLLAPGRRSLVQYHDETHGTEGRQPSKDSRHSITQTPIANKWRGRAYRNEFASRLAAPLDRYRTGASSDARISHAPVTRMAGRYSGDD